jgi:hypothetical protein
MRSAVSIHSLRLFPHLTSTINISMMEIMGDALANYPYLIFIESRSALFPIIQFSISNFQFIPNIREPVLPPPIIDIGNSSFQSTNSIIPHFGCPIITVLNSTIIRYASTFSCTRAPQIHLLGPRA